MAQRIVVCEYNPEWEAAYQREADLIADILADNLKEIFHIGSTAVKGLKAKPIIDIMPVVYRLEEVDRCNSKFQEAGYECMGEFGMHGRRYFRKGGDNRTHQIHIFEFGNQTDINRHLAVRDFLRTHKEVAEQYGELKAKLAVQFPNSIDDYCIGKEKFVLEMEEKALQWQRQCRIQN